MKQRAMNRLEYIDLMINELQGLAVSPDGEAGEQHLTRLVEMFEPLFVACALEYDWRIYNDELVS
jgi:hypothetical protein